MSPGILCDHDTVTLPSPLSDAQQAALAVPFTDDRTARLVIQRIVWALRRDVFGLKLTREHACAVLRHHTALAPFFAARSDSYPCLVAQQEWSQRPQRTELGVAERLVTVHGADFARVRAADGSGEWRVWDGRRWRDDDGTGMHALAKRVVREEVMREGAATSLGIEAEDEAKAAQAHARAAQAARFLDGVVKHVRTEHGVEVPAEEWDADPALLAVANGTLALGSDGAVLRAHDRADRLTRLGRAAYRLDAQGATWDQFIAAALPDPQVRPYVQRMAGYSLYGGNPERIMVVLIGPTSTGKSTLLETLAHVLGEHASPFGLSLLRAKQHEAPRADLVDALPRRLLITTEAADTWDLHAEQIKRVTGADSIAVRLGHDNKIVTGRPGFTPWMATNAAPSVIGADAALWRRLRVVPMDVQVQREDRRLGETLRGAEAERVLAWVVQGWNDYATNGLGEPPASCRRATLRMRSDLSLIDTWLAEETDTDAGHSEPSSALFGAWRSWCISARVHERDIANRIVFGRELGARGYGQGWSGGRRDRVRLRTGLRLTSEARAREILDSVVDGEARATSGPGAPC